MNTLHKSISVSIVLLFSFLLHSQERSISGKVIDGEEEVGLPYTSIAFVHSGGGTTTNQEGRFSLHISNAEQSDSIAFSYIGFDTYIVAVADIVSPLDVRLIPTANLLMEIIIRPISPEDYLKSVIRKVRLNQANSPFNTTAYYREEIRENGGYLRHSEGVFQSHHDSFQAKSESHHQLVLFRENKETKQLEFMADKARKERDKYLEEHPEDTTKFEEEELFLANFGGPSGVISIHVGNKAIPFLDSLQFRHFRYNYGQETSYSGREMLTIEFESKGVVEHVKSSGVLFIDKTTDAVVAMQWNGNVVIPLWVRPILFAMGMSIDAPTFTAEARFQEKDERWYPQQVNMDINISLTKKHLFKKNQIGSFDITQIYVVNELNRESPFDIPESVRYQSDEQMDDQIYWDGQSDWSQINVID